MLRGLSNLPIVRPSLARGTAVRDPSERGATMAAQSILAGVAILTPWLFGGVLLRDLQWLFIAVGAGLVLALVRSFRVPAAVLLPLAVAPLAFGAAIGALQLVPLSPSTLAVVSPSACRLRTELTPAATRQGTGESTPEARRGVPLSLYPASTRRDLAVLLLAVAMFVSGSLVFASLGGGLGLCITMAVGGALLAFFEIAQHLSATSVWRMAWSDAARAFGPFINRNNAAGYMNLCLGGALGMVVWAVGRSDAAGGEARAERSAWRRVLLAPFARLNATVIASLGLAACAMAGVLCTMSRGGGVAMAGAAIVTIVASCAARFNPVRIFALGVVMAAGVALVAWVGMTGRLQARFATLLDGAILSQTRIPHWRDGLRAAADFWPAGSGLGTYRFVYPLYQRRLDQGQYLHAENQYLETLVESGVVGLGLMLTMIAAVGAAAWRLLRYSGLPAGVALGVAGTFALVSQVLQGFVDFGLYIPANMLLFALLCGAVTGAAAALGRRLRPARPIPAWVRYGSCAFGLLLVAPTAWGALEIRAAAAVEHAIRDTRFLQLGTAASAELVRRGIDELAVAVADRPDDADAQQDLAMLWLAHYRAEATAELRRELPQTSAARLAELSSTIALHERAHQFRRNGWPDKLEALRNQAVVERSLPQAMACARAAARACPLLLDPHLVLARLAFLVGDPNQDEAHLARARRLQPADPEVLFRCGLLELQAGRFEEASCDWRQSLQLSARRTEEVLWRAETQMSFPYIVEKVLPDWPALLISLARTRYAGEHHANTRRLLAQRSARLLDRVALADDERHYLRGAARLLEGRRAEAASEYEHAVLLRPRDTEWRYELAVLLKEQGRLSEAHEHACLCAATAPRNGVYRGLLEQINHARLTGNSALK